MYLKDKSDIVKFFEDGCKKKKQIKGRRGARKVCL